MSDYDEGSTASEHDFTTTTTTTAPDSDHDSSHSRLSQDYARELPPQLDSPANAKDTAVALDTSTATTANSNADHSISATVSSPRKDSDISSKPYISYLVTTNTAHPAVLALNPHPCPILVRRRYHDFACLHACLANDFPATMIPPLPSKLNFKYLTGDTLSDAFVAKRLHSLDRFMAFIVGHTDLKQLAILHLFISDSPHWLNFTNTLKTRDMDEAGPSHSSGFVSKVVNEDLILETVMNFLTPSKYKRETNIDILEINDRLKKLFENLLKLDRIFVKLNKKNCDMSSDYKSFASHMAQIGQAYSGDSESVASNFHVFADCLLYMLQSWSLLGRYVDESFLVLLKDCSKYIASLTSLIELQHTKNVDVQVLRDYLAKAQTDLAGSGSGSGSGAVHPLQGDAPHLPPSTLPRSHANHGIVNNAKQLIKDTVSTSATSHVGSTATETKAKKLRDKIGQLEHEIAVQTAVVEELVHKLVDQEYPYWKQFNQNTLKLAMLGLCDQQIAFYSGLAENWGEAQHKLTLRLEELSM